MLPGEGAAVVDASGEVEEPHPAVDVGALAHGARLASGGLGVERSVHLVVGHDVAAVLVCLAVVFPDGGVVVICQAEGRSQPFDEPGEVLCQGEVGIEALGVSLRVGGSLCLCDRVECAREGIVVAAPEPVFVADGEGAGRHGVNHVPQVGGRAGPARLGQRSQQVELQPGAVGHVDVQVGTQVAACVFVLCGVAVVHVGVLDEAFVGHQSEQRVVAELGTSPAYLHRVLVRHAGVPERLVEPVHIGIEVGKLPVAEVFDFLVGIARCQFLVGACLVHGACIGRRVDELRLA